MPIDGKFLVVAAATMLMSTTVSADTRERDALLVLGQAGVVRADEEVSSAIVIGGDLRVEGEVRGVAAAVGGSLHVGPSARVDGPVAAVGGELVVDRAAQVRGARVHVASGDFSSVAGDLSAEDARAYSGLWEGALVRVFQVFAALAVGLVLASWMPQRVTVVREAVVRTPGRDLLLGLALLLALPPFCVLLGMSLVGIPMIPLAFLFVVCALTFGLVAVGAAIGRRLAATPQDDRLVRALVVGMLALAAGAALPVLGALVLLAFSVHGAGAVLATRFGTRPVPGGHIEDRSSGPRTGALGREASALR